MDRQHFDVLVIGAGIVGIATAYYLKNRMPASRIGLIDRGQPMALTSAQSGENYRNWWPHPVMTSFTDRSIELMEDIAGETGNRINLTRRGYVLATRSAEIDVLLGELAAGYAQSADSSIRIHERHSHNSYQEDDRGDWQSPPTGVDVISDQRLLHRVFPYYDPTVRSAIHIRRAGDVNSQQLGQYMLERFRDADGRRLVGEVAMIEKESAFQISVKGTKDKFTADQLVNAAGPFINNIAKMLGEQLPVGNVLQQKIAFEDTATAIPRTAPFSIDLDAQWIDWSDEEKGLLQQDSNLAWATAKMPGAIHCRPTGGVHGNWVKLGWAYNDKPEKPGTEPALSVEFPEIVLRGAARLNPALKTYYENLPQRLHHYGGYYTMTDENWPLIGAMGVSGSYVVGALSGYGTMAACAAGELCARWVTEQVAGQDKPDYATALSPQRYANPDLMEEIRALSSRGIL